MKPLARIALLSLTLASSLAHAAQSESQSELQPRPVQTETKWYAGEMGAVYGVATGFIVANALTDVRYPALTLSAQVSTGLGPSILHAVHGNYRAVAGSLALRGLFIGTLLAADDSNCWNIDGRTTSAGCSAVNVLMVAELLAIPVLDFALARSTVERGPVERPSSSSGMSLSMLPPSGSRPGLLALAGRF